MRLRECSEVGYLMQQWLGALVPETGERVVVADMAERAWYAMSDTEREQCAKLVERMTGGGDRVKATSERAEAMFCGLELHPAQKKFFESNTQDAIARAAAMPSKVGVIRAHLDAVVTPAEKTDRFVRVDRERGVVTIAAEGYAEVETVTSRARRLVAKLNARGPIPLERIPEEVIDVAIEEAGRELLGREVDVRDATDLGLLARELDEAYRRIGAAAAEAVEKYPAFKKIPGAQLTVSPVWAEAMGYDPDKLEDERD